MAVGRSERPAILCRGLVKRFPDVVAVAGIDLAVGHGECFGLLGPNGAGKTTTVEMLEGLLAPDAGTIEVLGHDGTRPSRALRHRLGIQLQQTQLVEKLTVLETLALFRSFYDRGIEPSEALELVRLEEKARSRVGKLSGGQRQRLSLACTLVCEPEILFLDEPTTGLDPQSRLQVWDIVGAFRRHGGTVLLTTHYMEEAQRLCDRVAILDHGRVIALGSPAELIASLGAEHVVEFEAAGPLDRTALERIDGVCAVREENGSLRLTVREVHRALPALLDELRIQGTTLTRLVTHHASLEDVFVAMTGRHLRED
jgi:ABC-2 type transport system ATP-binding protein